MLPQFMLLLFLLVFITEVPSHDILKVKRSELRLYCDLLMQQVHSVKDAATRQPDPDIEVIFKNPNSKRMSF